MAYVDGFIVPVPKKKLDDYKKLSRKCGKIWKEFGALEYAECVGDDIPPGKLTSFPLSVKLKRTEVAVFSWIVYKTKRQRDKINKQIMDDPRMKKMCKDPMPFDTKRMVWGGFKPIVRL